MWVCSCSTYNRPTRTWCFGCGGHYTYCQTYTKPQPKYTGTRSSKSPWRNAGKPSAQKESALTPFGRTKGPWEPSTPSRVTSALIAVPKSAATRDKREEKEKEKKEAQDPEEVKQHVQALMEAGVPEELREQLKKWIKEEPEITHGDVKKLKKYKTQVGQFQEDLWEMDRTWQEFKATAKKNWDQQRELYQEKRRKLVEQPKEVKTKLEDLQKEVKARTAKAGAAEEVQDVEEEEKEEEDQEVPPWEEEEEEGEEDDAEEDEDMTVEDLGNGKRAKSLLPFGGRKLPRK